MGCDGGTIPRRDELVRTKKKPEKKDKEAELNFKWRVCALSHEALQQPIVACEMGRLYNKDKIIEMLLDKNNSNEVTKHITSVKHIKVLNLTPNPILEREKIPGKFRDDDYFDKKCAPFVCPVVGLEMNGHFKFCFLWSCGCVLSERALKEVKTSVCFKCQKPFVADDVIVLNPTEEDLELTVAQMNARRAQSKSEKKAKREAKKVDGNSNEESGDGAGPSSSKQIKTEPSSELELSGMNGTSRTGKTLNGVGKKSTNLTKNAGSGQPKTTAFQRDKEVQGTTQYSVTKDPKASEVYKSLFTTSKLAQNQQRAHWVTYNPFYN